MVSIVKKELFDAVNANLNGTKLHFNPFSKLTDVFQIRDSQYILIGSNTGSGKTSLLDHMILSTIHSLPKDFHFEVLYYSMERKNTFKLAKWLSWEYYRKEKKKAPVQTLLGLNNRIKPNQVKYFETRYSKILENVMEHIDLRQGTRTVAQIKQDIEKKAKELGDYYHSDNDVIYHFDKVLAPFPKKKFIKTRFGKRYYVDFKEGKYQLYQNDDLYIPKKQQLLLIVIDHIGKVKGEGSKKQILDELDQVLSDARDKYGFSPIAISQFNRGVGETQRIKFRKDTLAPQLEDFKDTGNLTESADLVLSLFDPSRYQAWNSEGLYYGVNIESGMVTPSGKHRARSLHILKNSFGSDKAIVMLKFIGESGYFEVLPKDEESLRKVYEEIQKEK